MSDGRRQPDPVRSFHPVDQPMDGRPPDVRRQIGADSFNVETSINPDTETALLDVASYGKQLGPIEDAPVALL